MDQIVQNVENHQEIPTDIDIFVCDFQTTDQSKFSKHTYYIVKGTDQDGNFEVQRRFKDFLALRNLLIRQWPGCYVPSLPGKKLFKANDINTANDRLKFLNAFCLKLSRLSHLYKCVEITQIFLRSKDQNIYKILDSKQTISLQELIDRYKRSFSNIVDLNVDDVIQKKINDFEIQLKNQALSLQKAKKFIKDTVQSSHLYNMRVSEIIQHKLINFEQSFIKQFIQGNEQQLFFYRLKQELEQQFKQDQVFKYNNIEILLDLVRLELKDCKVLLKQIQDKIEINQKIKSLEDKIEEQKKYLEKNNNGQKSIVDMLKQKSQDKIKNEIDEQLLKINKELELTKQLEQFVSNILVHIEIEQYQNDRNQQFKEIMQTLQQMELDSIHIEQSYWTHIYNQSNYLISQTQNQFQHNLNDNNQDKI